MTLKCREGSTTFSKGDMTLCPLPAEGSPLLQRTRFRHASGVRQLVSVGRQVHEQGDTAGQPFVSYRSLKNKNDSWILSEYEIQVQSKCGIRSGGQLFDETYLNRFCDFKQYLVCRSGTPSSSSSTRIRRRAGACERRRRSRSE